jgi:hypothetical protein
MSLDTQVRNGSNPVPEEVQDHHSLIPTYDCQLNTTSTPVQSACGCAHHPHVLTATDT